MDNTIQLGAKFKIVTLVMIAVGVVTIIAGFATGDIDRTWANLLLNNYYFMSVTIGATFWMAIQAITQSGWSSAFVRIPQAMSNYLIVSFFLFMILFLGLHDLYHWTHHDAVMNDPILLHKKPYLNIPFFAVRYVLFFGLWIFLTQRIRKLSLQEDKLGGTAFFEKIEFTSKVYIFVLAITFSLFSIDWLMSLDAHWYSTIYAIKKFVMAFYHGTSIVLAILIILHKMGHFPMLTKTHMADFSRWLFVLSMIWGYVWLSQYLLIWYANIPEETIYYVPRILGEYKNYFYAELLINWFFPFLYLMWNRVGKNANAMLFIILVLMVGQWVELYMSIMPNTIESHSITYVEIGSFVGFAGIFALVVGWSLTKAPLVPKNHPYLVESLEHGHEH